MFHSTVSTGLRPTVSRKTVTPPQTPVGSGQRNSEAVHPSPVLSTPVSPSESVWTSSRRGRVPSRCPPRGRTGDESDRTVFLETCGPRTTPPPSGPRETSVSSSEPLRPSRRRSETPRRRSQGVGPWKEPGQSDLKRRDSVETVRVTGPVTTV